MPIKQNNITFGVGKSILFSDFDGTLLPQSLHDVYNGSNEQKRNAVDGFNKYFSEIQDFSNSSHNKFEIIITTGRRLNRNNQEGFLPAYQRIRQEGIMLPRIKEIITAEGGDIFSFSENGDVSQTIKPEKAALVRKLTGWDNGLINKTLEDVSQKLNTSYEMVDEKGSYKLSLKLADNSKIQEFVDELQGALMDKIKCRIKKSDVKVDNNKTQGIVLYPLIEGQKLNKSFDVKMALEDAIKNDDFIIAAGDSSNDKEMLNIFNYVRKPENLFIPQKAEEITQEYVSLTRQEIDKLPIKLLFVKPNSPEKHSKKLEIYEFMKKQAELFPEKVMIVEETKLYGENNLLNAVKNAINNYAEKNSVFKNAWNGIVSNSDGANGVVNDVAKPKKSPFKIVAIALGVVALGVVAYKKIFATHKSNDDIEKANVK